METDRKLRWRQIENEDRDRDRQKIRITIETDKWTSCSGKIRHQGEGRGGWTDGLMDQQTNGWTKPILELSDGN